MDLDSGDARIHRYWDPLAVAEAGCDAPLSGTDDEIVDQVDSSIREVVRDHLLSDMPVGCFLSGGIDSATVLAAARGATDRPIRAFTAGFESPELDERATARRTASALGVELVEIEMNARAMLRIVPELPDVHDEPFADSSQIPTLLVSREMRRHASVALSGDGGDEIFGGYHRHAHAATGWPRERFLPRHVRRAIGRSARTLSPRTWDRCLAIIGPLRRGGLRSAGAGARLHKWADALASDSERDAYETITSMWPRGMPPFPDNSATSWWSVEAASRLPDFLRRMQYMDQTGYLVDDALVKVDRMSMAASLEVRVPLLDHRLVELAWRLPVQARVRDGQGKWILRRILDRHVPSSIVRAPKAGFAVPLDAWLRGPLRTWARDRVIGGMEHARRILDADARTRAWERFEAGRFPADAIWSIAMLVSWCERWGADR
jgi:asparagine synthase (glutamine-hydrolysing)